VVVHELCHRLEMNHSPAFWAQVKRVLPDYQKSREWLKKHEKELIKGVILILHKYITVVYIVDKRHIIMLAPMFYSEPHPIFCKYS
ncbi:MAG: M48 family metallopeptidase, partial [Bacteroidaceae bacterium]|nr:M48 family metallopeptidase [Bacteroidaceae bacterium]